MNEPARVVRRRAVCSREQGGSRSIAEALRDSTGAPAPPKLHLLQVRLGRERERAEEATGRLGLAFGEGVPSSSLSDTRSWLERTGTSHHPRWTLSLR